MKLLKRNKKLFITLAVSSLVIGGSIFGPKIVNAGKSFNGGEYTNLCGSGFAANSYSCQANCNPDTGTCTGVAVAKYTCEGKTTDCRQNEIWGTNLNLGNPGPNKTVQLDVFDKPCRDANGNWTCNAGNLKGYMVWYSGAGQEIQCNTNQVSLSASPSTIRVGEQIRFTISGDASTFINDNFGGGVTNCSGTWNDKTCTAAKTGSYNWTHQWRTCVDDFNHCSAELCQKSTGFNVIAAPIPTPTNTPTPTPTKSPTPTPTKRPTSTPTPTKRPTPTPTKRVTPTPTKSPTPTPTRIVTVTPTPQNVVSCPAGFTKTIKGSNIICIQQVQNQNQTQRVNQVVNAAGGTATNGPVNITVQNPAPQVVAQPEVLAAKTPVVVEALPKTGLPVAAWALTGFLPAGIGIKKWTSRGDKDNGLLSNKDGANFIWQLRQFGKDN